jgi:hypothetical protein
MKSLIAAIAITLVLTVSTFAKDKKDYQIGVLQKHAQDTQRIGTDFNGINCDSGRCVGSAAGIYATSNWWHIRVDGGYWELQPNWQDNSKHNPLNTAKEGDKILFRMAKRHYLNGTFDVAYLPRTDDPDKEVMLIAKWVSDHPVVTPQVQPKSQMEVACATGKLTPDQQKQFCTPPSAPVTDATPNVPTPSSEPTASAPQQDAVPDTSPSAVDAQIAVTIPMMSCTALAPQVPLFQSKKDDYPRTWAAIQSHCPAESGVPVLTPAEQAQKAQQHADCLKAAVDNPSIVCK